MASLADLPAHLRRHIVRQDYAAYNEVAHAVWRFVLLNLRSHLRDTAHPAYLAGLEQTGIGLERIPHIEEMDECLSRFGWRAVCVDGFIPPRAFQELQALGVLAIAAEIRSLGHLAYTPAPDIIHEAAGHAPFLVVPEYASYLKQIGQASSSAFSLPEDRLVYDAIYWLSEIKEDPSATPEQLEAASLALSQAEATARSVSEATRLARLYWWTAEYGLIGRLDDFKIYGAGLLSSLGESHSCFDQSVTKLPLSFEAADRAYDVTRPQPVLYVARDFEHLSTVTAELEAELACNRGGSYALETARASREAATVTLSGVHDFALIGRVDDFGATDGAVKWLRFTEPFAIVQNGQIERRLPRGLSCLPLGALKSGHYLDATSQAEFRSQRDITLEYQNGLLLKARLDRVVEANGCILALELSDVQLFDGAHLIAEARHGCLPAAREVQSVRRGSPDPAFYSDPDLRYLHDLALDGSEQRAPTSTQPWAPKPRNVPRQEAELAHLYERAIETWRSLAGGDVVHVFEEVHGSLMKNFPTEWLLRWNLLESLLKLGEKGNFAQNLEVELLRLEVAFNRREPIATGLRYLREAHCGPSGQSQRSGGNSSPPSGEPQRP